jgi:hypothetical protein
MRAWVCITIIIMLEVALPHAAIADGALKDSDQILLPQSQPHRVLLRHDLWAAHQRG